jgi:subfamily B ATP-binding cassette protein HlyB/CyaB
LLSNRTKKKKKLFLILKKEKAVYTGNFSNNWVSTNNLWYIYIFAALFSATTAQIAVFTNQILIDSVLPTYNLNTLVLFAALDWVSIKYSIFYYPVYKNFVSIHLGNALDRYFLFSFDDKINNSSLSYIHSYKKGDLMERVSDSMKLKTFFMKFFTGILVDIIVSIYSLCILFFIDKMLTLIVVAVMVFFSYGSNLLHLT